MRKLEWIGAGVVGLVMVASVTFVWASDIGFGVKTDTTVADVGLPLYPGARPHKEDKDDHSGARIWGSFGAFGMKIAVVELDSNDEPAKIAPFYRSALRKYGPVLDCSAGAPPVPKAAKDSDSLDCSDNHGDRSAVLYKTGVKENFHLVGIEPRSQGSKIALVAIQLRGVH